MEERPRPSTPPKEFWCDCRLAVTVEGPRGLVSQVVPKPFAIVGGHADADIRLAGSGMALKSLYLHATESGVYCVPLFASQQGTCAAEGWLQEGQALRVDHYRITVRLLSGAAENIANGVPPPNLDAARSVPRPYPLLRIAVGDREVAQRALKRRLTLVGRIKPCTLRVRDADLSAAHAMLYWDGADLWAIDLLSRTGTWFEQRTIECLRIPAGRELRLGEVRLTLVAPPARQPHAAPRKLPAEPAEKRVFHAPAPQHRVAEPQESTDTADTARQAVLREALPQQAMQEQLSRQQGHQQQEHQRQMDALAAEKEALQVQLLDAIRESARARDESQRSQQELQRQVDALTAEKDSLQLQLLDAMRATVRARDELEQARQALRREQGQRTAQEQARQLERAEHCEELTRRQAEAAAAQTIVAAATQEIQDLRHDLKQIRAELAARNRAAAAGPGTPATELPIVLPPTMPSSATVSVAQICVPGNGQPAASVDDFRSAEPTAQAAATQPALRQRPVVPTGSGIDAFDCVLERLVERHRSAGWWHRIRQALRRPFRGKKPPAEKPAQELLDDSEPRQP